MRHIKNINTGVVFVWTPLLASQPLMQECDQNGKSMGAAPVQADAPPTAKEEENPPAVSEGIRERIAAAKKKDELLVIAGEMGASFATPGEMKMQDMKDELIDTIEQLGR